MAKVSVKNHRNAVVNPMAQLRRELTIEEVLNSRIIAWPTTMYMCSLYSEGAAALVLASEEKAKEITDIPIWISGIACSEYSVSPYLVEATLGRLMGTNLAAKKAYEMAGIKDPLNEIDVIEVLDFISGLEILNYEELQLCRPGEGGKMIDDGITEKEGWMPVNPSGGTGARGHIGGLSGAFALTDLVLHLREEAGPIQVPIRKKGLGLMQCAEGGYTQNAVLIVERGG
jgi:acetyl-CoA acetyltransferase